MDLFRERKKNPYLEKLAPGIVCVCVCVGVVISNILCVKGELVY